jgi:hypothetical protein
LDFLLPCVNGDQEPRTFIVAYADGTPSSFRQSLSDWAASRRFTGESVALSMPHRLIADDSKDGRTFYAYVYSFTLDANKTVRNVSLPSNRDVLVPAVTLAP